MSPSHTSFIGQETKHNLLPIEREELPGRSWQCCLCVCVVLDVVLFVFDIFPNPHLITRSYGPKPYECVLSESTWQAC